MSDRHVTDRQELQHPRFARKYLQIAPEHDRRGGAEHRERLLSGLSGRVLEIGAGQGRNFPHFPDSVHEVLAVEPEATLRSVAERAAASAAPTVRVVSGEASDLPANDGEFDAVVSSLVLCSVRDPASALAEMIRVLRPGGRLRFYEHVRSPRRWPGRLQDVIAPLWRRAAGECSPNRDTEAAIRAAGFTITEIDRFGFAFSTLTPKVPHVLGTGLRP